MEKRKEKGAKHLQIAKMVDQLQTKATRRKYVVIKNCGPKK